MIRAVVRCLVYDAPPKRTDGPTEWRWRKEYHSNARFGGVRVLGINVFNRGQCDIRSASPPTAAVRSAVLIAYGHQPDTNPDSVTVTEKSMIEKPHRTLSDPGIEPRTPCSAVALATTRPTKQLF